MPRSLARSNPRTLPRIALTYLVVSSLALLGPAAALAQTPSQGEEEPTGPQSALAHALAEHSSDLSLEDGELRGAGAELLLQEARKARYVLLGEDHGIAEMSSVAEALLRQLQPRFQTYVTEVGPWSARQLIKLAQAEQHMQALDDFYRKHPLAIPFAHLQEEAELLRAVVDIEPAAEEPIWGVDQEFILGPQLHFDRLAQQATGEAAQALRSLADAERATLERIVQEGNPNQPMFLNSPLPESWPTIRDHFAQRGDSAPIQLLDDLERSRVIYEHVFSGRSYLNNHQRGELMKSNLRQYFARHGRDRPLLVKLGVNHVMRGWSTLGISDVGNFLAETAALDGEKSLHVLLLAKSGLRNAWLPFTPPEAQATPIDLSAAAFKPFHPLVEALPEADGWSLIDLRPLRHNLYRWRRDVPSIEPLLNGFDLILVIDQGHPATLFPSLVPASEG